MVVKSQVVLYIFEELINKRPVKSADIISEYQISVRTFRRYIAEINAYFANKYRMEYVAYDRNLHAYILK